jgi:hypothetical protein
LPKSWTGILNWPLNSWPKVKEVINIKNSGKMKKVILIISIVIAGVTNRVEAQFVVADPAHIATSIVNSINQIVETSSTASNMINNFKEVQKVYNQGV